MTNLTCRLLGAEEQVGFRVHTLKPGACLITIVRTTHMTFQAFYLMTFYPINPKTQLSLSLRAAHATKVCCVSRCGSRAASAVPANHESRSPTGFSTTRSDISYTWSEDISLKSWLMLSLLTVQTESTVYQEVMMNILIKGSFSVGHCNKLPIYPFYPLPQTTGLNA